MPFQYQNLICTLLNRILLWIVSVIDIYCYLFLKVQIIVIYESKMVKIFRTCFLFSKEQIMFWSWGDLGSNHVNFCLFWVWLGYSWMFLFVLSLIYLLIVICGSFTLGRLFDFISTYFWLNGALYFSLKNLFCEKAFKIDFCSFLIDQVFFKEKIIFYIFYVFFL